MPSGAALKGIVVYYFTFVQFIASFCKFTYETHGMIQLLILKIS